MIIVFIKKEIKERVKNVDSDEIKTGLMGGAFGNKGACRVKLDIDDSSFCFTCCHLESGQKNVEERNEQFSQINDRAFYDGKIIAKDFDYKFFFGDLNYRIDLSYGEVTELLSRYQDSDYQKQKEILDTLLQKDQLKCIRETAIKAKDPSKYYIRCYKEEKIDFAPTYKYDLGTNRYDTSKKQRTPSWCDRILYWNNQQLTLVPKFYKRRENLESDHR